MKLIGMIILACMGFSGVTFLILNVVWWRIVRLKHRSPTVAITVTKRVFLKRTRYVARVFRVPLFNTRWSALTELREICTIFETRVKKEINEKLNKYDQKQIRSFE